MTDSVSERERQLSELKGALDLLFREEFAQWLEEAEDCSKREELENVLGHIEALESESPGRPAEESEVRLGLFFVRNSQAGVSTKRIDLERALFSLVGEQSP